MKILNQLGLIIGIWFAGEVISRGLSLPVPGSIIGMLLLLLMLFMGIVKAEKLREVSDFFLKNLAFFFIPAGVGVMAAFDIIKGSLLLITVIVIISTFIVMAVSGLVTELIIKFTGGGRNGNP